MVGARMTYPRPRIVAWMLFMSVTTVLGASDSTPSVDELLGLELSELMDMRVSSASKFEESVTDTPATVLVITQQDIEDRGYHSLPELFADLPGFDVIAAHGDVQQLVYARGNRTGSYNERTLLLINGIEHNHLFSQHMNIDTDFPLTAIKRIEVLYGPSSAVYGPNAFSGVINIITHSPRDLEDGEGRVYSRVGGGSQNTVYGEGTVLVKQRQVGFSASYRRYRSDRIDLTDRPGYFANGSIIGNERVWGPYTSHFMTTCFRRLCLMTGLPVLPSAIVNGVSTGNSNGPRVKPGM